MRKIIHIDMDAFFASVALRDHPELGNLPVVIASHHPRAVIAAASYPARRFGLASAMSMHQARQLCPKVIAIEPDFELYRAVSEQIHQIFRQYTQIIEPVSLDEAYLDVSENLKHFPSATDVAIAIRADILAVTGLTASAGVAPNKFLAKIASEWKKPDGLCVIKPHQVHDFIQHLDLKKIPGVGRVTQEKLTQLGLLHLGDVQQIDEQVLIHHFGKYGQRLYLYAQGIDERPVQAERQRQQISKETTFDHNYTLQQCLPYWDGLIESVWQSLNHKKLQARGLSIKLKSKDFQVLQRSRSFKHAFNNIIQIKEVLEQLLNELPAASQMQFRLIGVGVFQLSEIKAEQQLSLWD